MVKVDFKKEYRELYGASARPGLVRVPEGQYLSIQGQGDPNRPLFARSVEALYGVAYGIKMWPKSHPVDEHWFDYVMPPMEGIWDTVDGRPYDPRDKENLRWSLLILQPGFLTRELFERVREERVQKKKDPQMERVDLIRYEEGLCGQILHQGPYDDEPATLELLERFLRLQGLKADRSRHHEIYLSDPRKTVPERLKTILRLPVSRATEVPRQ